MLEIYQTDNDFYLFSAESNLSSRIIDETVESLFESGSLQSVSSISTTSSSSSLQLKSQNKINRKRKIEENPRAQFYLPRIPRRDIRRQYAQMLCNVYNSHDPELMENYLNTFDDPNIILLFRKINGGVIMKEGECRGREKIGGMWMETLKDSPDAVFALKQTQIKVRSDGTSMISSTFTLSGTHVLSTKERLEILKQMNSSLVITNEKNGMKEMYQCPATSYLEPAAAPNTVSSFDEEFEQALTEYLNENPLPSSYENQICKFLPNHLQPIYSVPFQLHGHFSLHLDAESIVYHMTYTLFDDICP